MRRGEEDADAMHQLRKRSDAMHRTYLRGRDAVVDGAVLGVAGLRGGARPEHAHQELRGDEQRRQRPLRGKLHARPRARQHRQHRQLLWLATAGHTCTSSTVGITIGIYTVCSSRKNCVHYQSVQLYCWIKNTRKKLDDGVSVPECLIQSSTLYGLYGIRYVLAIGTPISPFQILITFLKHW